MYMYILHVQYNMAQGIAGETITPRRWTHLGFSSWLPPKHGVSLSSEAQIIVANKSTVQSAVVASSQVAYEQFGVNHFGLITDQLHMGSPGMYTTANMCWGYHCEMFGPAGAARPGGQWRHNNIRCDRGWSSPIHYVFLVSFVRDYCFFWMKYQ